MHSVYFIWLESPQNPCHSMLMFPLGAIFPYISAPHTSIIRHMLPWSSHNVENTFPLDSVHFLCHKSLNKSHYSAKIFFCGTIVWCLIWTSHPFSQWPWYPYMPIVGTSLGTPSSWIFSILLAIFLSSSPTILFQTFPSGAIFGYFRWISHPSSQ